MPVTSRSVTITFDAADPAVMARFWATALGYDLQGPPGDFDSWEAFADANDIPIERRNDIAAITDPEASGPRLLFLKVPEAKTAKNRVHLDVHCGVERGSDRDEHLAAIAPIVEELVGIGATQLESFEEHGARWTVLLDPEGNEFCVV